MSEDPKMLETAAWIGTGHLREVCAGNDMNVYLSSERDRFTDIALVVREEALAYAEALAAARVAQERERWATAARLCVQATPEQLPMALDALADVLSAQPPETGKEN